MVVYLKQSVAIEIKSWDPTVKVHQIVITKVQYT